MAVEKVEATLDLEALKGKERLSESDNEAIRNAAMSEYNKEHGIKEPEAENKEVVSTPENKETAELSEEEKKAQEAKDAEEKAKADKVEEERLLTAKEEDLKDEEKVKKAELIKKQDEAKAKALDEEVATYAKENNISLDEAKKEIESIGKISEKYNSDPKQLSKANLHLQRLYTKNETELKNILEKQKAEPPLELSDENIVKHIDDGKFTIGKEKATREGIIEAYKQKEPEITATMEDDAIFKLAVKTIKKEIEFSQKQQLFEISSKAKDKRAELISKLSDEEKQFLPEIKPIIDNLPDTQVMKEDFSLNDFIYWAKGKTLEAKVKESEERGYKKGVEEAKILAQKAKPATPQTPAKKSATEQLTQAEKNDALDKYQSLDLPDEKKFELYIDSHKSKPKK